MRLILAMALTFAVGGPCLAAQPIGNGAAMESLRGLASGDCPPETCFDGQPILRREHPFVVLSETKTGEISGYERRDGTCPECVLVPESGDGGVFRENAGGYYHAVPARVMYFDQRLAIANRGSYVKEKAKASALVWGAGFGWFVGFCAGAALFPLGAAAAIAGGITAVALLATTAYQVSAAKARRAPTYFERSITRFAPLDQDRTGETQ